MIARTKGKALEGVAPSKLDRKSMYLVETKFDGNYIQIHKHKNNVTFFTSGGKQFHWDDVEHMLVTKFPHTTFVLEGEYTEHTEGMLGDRPKAAKLTTYRTNFTKRIPSSLGTEKVKIFDIIQLSAPTTMKEHSVENLNAVERHALLNRMFNGYFKDTGLQVVKADLMTLDEAIEKAKRAVNKGWEGVYARVSTSKLQPGKRVNDCLKIKFRKTVDLLCVGVEPGEGKYTGMIGSLILQDSKGRVVKVGSGLSDTDRTKGSDYFMNEVIEIEYEQIIGTYIQPTFIAVREDKRLTEID